MSQCPFEKFTFVHLQGSQPRSGSNYLSKIMSCHPAVQCVPPARTTGEFPLLRTLPLWDAAFSRFKQKYVVAGGFTDREVFQFDAFARYLGDSWLRFVADTFALQPGHVFLKDPNVKDIDMFFDLFPKAKLIILVRDGRDNVASLVRAGMGLQGMKAKDKLKRRLNHLVWRDFVSWAYRWSESVHTILEFDKKFRHTLWASQYMIIRYEDVCQNPKAMGERLFTFMGLDFNEQILTAVEDAEVIGSSFYTLNQQEDARAPNWIPTPKTEAFRPNGRWKQWGAMKKRLFKHIAGKELIAFGYEKDLNW